MAFSSKAKAIFFCAIESLGRKFNGITNKIGEKEYKKTACLKKTSPKLEFMLFQLLALDANTAGTALQMIEGNLAFLGIGVVAIIAAIIILFFFKNIIVNSILGIIAWAILSFVFHVNLNFWISLVVSIIFGLPGIGVLLILKFFGIG